MVFITKPKHPLLFLFLSTLFLSTSLSSTLAYIWQPSPPSPTCEVCALTSSAEYCRARYGCPYFRSQGSDNCMQQCEMKMSDTWQKDQCKNTVQAAGSLSISGAGAAAVPAALPGPGTAVPGAVPREDEAARSVLGSGATARAMPTDVLAAA
ncbi:hypothetical protein ACFX1X_022464 [Malus domestica]